MMTAVKPIRTPGARVWRNFKRRVLPVVVWLGAIVAVAALMNKRGGAVNAVGMAEEVQADVIALVDGSVRFMHAGLFDAVERGRIIAVLDDQLISRQIETARRELKRLKSDYERARLELNFDRAVAHVDFAQRIDARKLDALNALRRLELDRDEARIEFLDRRIEREINQAELVYRNALAEVFSGASDVVATIDVNEALAKQAALKVRFEQSAETVEDAEALYQAAELRFKTAKEEFSASIPAGGQTLEEILLAFDPAIRLKPLTDAVAVQESIVEELLQQKQQLVLHAPFDGIIAAIDATVGETVVRGMRIMEIHSPDVPCIRGWIDQQWGYEPRLGAEVEITSRSHPRRSMRGRIVEIGRRIERLPLRLSPNPNLPRFGRTIMITGFESGLLPGEVLDIRFIQDSV